MGEGQRDPAPHHAARLALAQRWRTEGWHGDATMGAVLEGGARAHPDATLVFASRTRPETLTVAEVRRRGVALAAALHRRGLRPGDVLVLQLPSWSEWAVAWYAAMHAGLVVAPVVHIYGPAELGYIVRDAGARALITPDRWRSYDYLERIDAMGPCPDLDLVVTVGEETVPGGVIWDDLLRQGGDDDRGGVAAAVEPRADDTCLLLYTSGTTAAPKGVVHTHNTFLAEIATMAQELQRGPEVVFLNGGPAGHVTGALTITRPFLDGSTAVSMDAWSADDAVELALRHRVTHSVGAPVFLSTMLDVAETRGVTLPLTEFMLGAAAVTPTAVERADAAGIAGYRCYGSTEHPTISTGHPWDPYDVRASTDGSVVAGTQVRIVDEDGRDVPPGVDGDILTVGPDQSVRYLDPDLDREAFDRDGWYRTGDIGHLGGGALTITDRRKDIIIRGGENLSSKEIEDALCRHPAVVDAAVVASPHPVLGESACAFVVLRGGGALDLEVVRGWFEGLGLARQKTPERVVVVDDLPRTPTGKVRKYELRQQIAEAGAGDGAGAEAAIGAPAGERGR